MKSKTYEEFVEKFVPKKTTDDCYTPESIYVVIRDWACKEYGIDPERIVRPFWPGGDYEHFDYPEGCVVLDNPPFSILPKICRRSAEDLPKICRRSDEDLTKICRRSAEDLPKICTFYLDRGIPFFLFAPSLTCFSGKETFDRMNHLICDANIVYENGAVVKTSFVTSCGDGDIVAQTAPELTKQINAEEDRLRKQAVKPLPKYSYPDHVVTSALMQRYARYGIDFKVRRSECVRIGELDAQKEKKKSIYGYGLLMSERAAAERAAAERWKLSEREKKIVESLSQGQAEQEETV